MKRAFTLLSAIVIALLPFFSSVNSRAEAKAAIDQRLDVQDRSISIQEAETTQSLYLGFDQMTDFEVDEFGKIWLAGMVPDGWSGKNLNDPITGNEFYDLWRSFTVTTLGIPESQLDSSCWNWIQGTLINKAEVERGTAGMLYVFAFLQNQLKLADYDSFQAGMATSTARGSLYDPLIAEYLDQNYNEYRAQNGGAVWGSVLAAITRDMVSGAPMFDVDARGYIRLTDDLTYKEALQMLYRFSHSNRWVSTAQGAIPFDAAAATISLTAEQQAMAAVMPLPTYADLPDWQGVWMTGDRGGFDVKYQYEEDYRTLAELGFNHLRYTVFVSDLLSADHTQFDAQILHALDNAIAYAIKYGIHLSLNIKVSSDNQNDMFVNWSNYAYLKEMYRALAARYQDVPSNALSFYLFFEPAVNDAYAASDPSRYITDARYAEICYELADVIWSVDPDRFISVDGITFGREPSIALAQEGVRRASQSNPGLGTIAQSFHYFSNGVTWTNGFYGEAPSLTSWPLPYVQNALYAGGPTITLNANSAGFPAGTLVKVNQTQQGASPSYLALNGDSTKEINGSSVTFTLNAGANNLVLSSTTSNSYNDIDTIWITYPYPAEQPIPIFGFFTDASGSDLFSHEVGSDNTSFNTNVLPGLLNGMPLTSILGTLVRRFETRQIVVISCGGDFLNLDDWGSVSTTVTLTEAYGYTSDNAWSFGPEYTRAFLQPWLDYEMAYHTETMLTEFAANNGSTEAIMASILDEELSAMKANGIAWSGIAGFGNTNGAVFDDFVYQGNYQRWRTHWYDVARMQVLHENMTTFDVSVVGRQTFTGRKLTPEVTVSFEGTPLVEGTDYTLSFFDNLDYGTAVIRVLGIGNYAGKSRTICFTISPFNPDFALLGHKIYIPFIGG